VLILPKTNQPSHVLIFGPFQVDLTTHELRKFDTKIRIPEQSFQVLSALLESPGKLITREALRSRLWPPDTYVDFERSLTVAVNRLRAALADSAEEPRYIETLPRLGYRFIASLEVVSNVPKTEPSIPAPFKASESSPQQSSGQPLIDDNRSSRTQRQSPRALNGRMLAIAAILLLVCGTIVWRNFRTGVPAADRTMMVVLPVENLTGDATQEYLCEGMTEELIAQLGNLDPDHLGVIARTTAMHYRGTQRTVKEIGGELGVGYVLESSIRRVDHRVRITTQLIEVQDQRHLWARTFDRDSSDILNMQSDVSQAIAEALPGYLNLSREAHRLLAPPNNSEAYVDYLKGRYFWNKRGQDGLRKSIEYFKEAIKQDPNYARAYAGLADSYLALGGDIFPPHRGYQLGEAAAAKALALDPNLAEAHTSVAYFKFIDEWDWKGADLEFRRALALDPAYATAHHWYAIYLSAMNRMPEAIREIETAHEFDPLSVPIDANLGAIYYQSGEFEKSIRQLQKTIELDPNFVAAYGYMGYVYQVTGRYDQALAEYKTAQQITGTTLSYLGDVGRIYALTGRKEEARALLQTSQGYSKNQPQLSAFTLCLIHSSLGDLDEGLKLLQKSIDDREFTATELTHDLRIDNLRADPRFAQVLREFNIPYQQSKNSMVPRIGSNREP
jgi:TolB-like protein/DNA-binding winged helix-turn-helix (wHTH) protein/Flp pilus assembly protein TadD